MNIRIRISRALAGLCLLVAAGAGLIPVFCGAETTAVDTTASAVFTTAIQRILEQSAAGKMPPAKKPVAG